MTDAINSVLSQIRALQTQARGPGALPPAAPGLDRAAGNAIGGTGVGGVDGGKPVGFGETLQRTLGQVNRTQLEARDLATAFELGDPRADLARVMVAQQQSAVAFRATVEVRNRLVQAYQDVMNMPL